jgi:hypothetical protein
MNKKKRQQHIARKRRSTRRMQNKYIQEINDLAMEVTRYVFVPLKTLRTCVVCKKYDESGKSLQLVENLATHEGLCACTGKHTQMAKHAMHLYQTQHDRLSVRCYLSGTDTETRSKVSFYRKSIGAIQREAFIVAPVTLTYCGDRDLLRVLCGWKNTDDEEIMSRSVTVENLRHYNPSLRIECVFPSCKHIHSPWQVRWDSRSPTSSKHHIKTFMR